MNAPAVADPRHNLLNDFEAALMRETSVLALVEALLAGFTDDELMKGCRSVLSEVDRSLGDMVSRAYAVMLAKRGLPELQGPEAVTTAWEEINDAMGDHAARLIPVARLLEGEGERRALESLYGAAIVLDRVARDLSDGSIVPTENGAAPSPDRKAGDFPPEAA